MLLCLELCSRGTCAGILHDMTQSLTWASPLHGWVREISSSLLYLHSAFDPPLVHRDLKSANVLINGAGQAKLSDLGEARFVVKEKMTQVGTL